MHFIVETLRHYRLFIRYYACWFDNVYFGVVECVVDINIAILANRYKL